MTTTATLENLVGHWTGTSRLWRPWLSPPESDSKSTATVGLTANGRFVTIAYTWACDGDDHEGFMLLGLEPRQNIANAAWVDSWHMSDKPMICAGTVDEETGAITLRGSYAAPPGPDWSWRTIIAPREDEAFEMVMYNISPDGEEAIAFRNGYGRRS